MQPKRRLGLALAGAATVVAGPVLVFPLLALGAGSLGGPGSCNDDSPAADGSPSIQGTAALDIEDLVASWHSTGQGQPARLGQPVEAVIDLYVSEGEDQGVRGDIALAQAIHETGWFTSADTARNNFAGIATFDGRPVGRAFPDVATGVRAHIQLLAKFAGGNDTQLTHPDIAPDAQAQATTWAQLAGTWATDPNYWGAISSLYQRILASAGNEAPDSAAVAEPQDCPPPQPVDPDDIKATPGNVPLAKVEGITGGVHRKIQPQIEALLDEAATDGLQLTGSGYRSPSRQIELRRAHCGTSQYAIHKAPASSCSPPTARPGTSMHEVGLAIDFSCNGTLIRSRSSRCFRWLVANAAAFGLSNLASEPWHWSIDGT